jgi:hypothetical protein
METPFAVLPIDRRDLIQGASDLTIEIKRERSINATATWVHTPVNTGRPKTGGGAPVHSRFDGIVSP